MKTLFSFFCLSSFCPVICRADCVFSYFSVFSFSLFAHFFVSMNNLCLFDKIIFSFCFRTNYLFPSNNSFLRVLMFHNQIYNFRSFPNLPFLCCCFLDTNAGLRILSILVGTGSESGPERIVSNSPLQSGECKYTPIAKKNMQFLTILK